jgi:DNA-binding NtrC family response regulator
MAKLLIVDDEAEICEFLKDFFETQSDCEILTASDSASALQIIKDQQPEGVLLDVRLGTERTGLDILNDLRVLSPGSKAIMVTASYDQDTIHKAKLLGAVDYITKPFTLEYLEETVKAKIIDILD